MGCLKKWLLLMLLAAGIAFAAPGVSPQDLKKVQKAIDETSREVQSKKNAQNKIAADISDTDKKLKQQRLELDKILREKNFAVKNLNQLQENAAVLQTRINGTRTQVARLLNAQYRNRSPDALILMLQNADPNDKGRQLQYMRYIQAANRKVMDDLVIRQQELAQQSEKIRVQIIQIQSLLEKQQKVVRELSRQKSTQLSAADKLDDDISKNRQKIKNLKDDEVRMSALLRRIATKNKTRRTSEKKTVRANHPSATVQEDTGRRADETKPLPSATPKTTTQTLPDTAFTRLQGQLRLPVSGSLSGRFGTAKPSGGAWNGLYIATVPQSVEAVAEGDVAYAGELRGYGNTVIVDHDGSYLTVYAGLSSLSVSRGTHVSARQSLGSSGALPGEGDGLYFEIRYHTRPMNPSGWVR